MISRIPAGLRGEDLPLFLYTKQLSCQSSSTLALRLAVGLCRPVMRSRGITLPRTLHSVWAT